MTISLFFISWSPGLFLSSLFSKRIGRRWVLLLGVVISNIAFYSCYFAIQISFIIFNIVFAAIAGFGIGIAYGISVHIVAQSAGKNIGLFTSLLMTSASIGSILITQLITWYTNPEDEVPSWKIGPTDYFTQRDVVDKVPSMFLVLGGVMTTMHIAGLMILLLSKAAIFSGSDVKEMAETDILKCRDCGEVGREEESDRGACPNTYKSADSAPDMLPKQDQDYTPKQMLKTATFYALCLSFLITEFSSILMINYYKLFGQIWIKHDHFLSTIGTTSILTMAVVRAINGIALDRFGVRICLMVLLGSLILVTSWFYFTAMAGSWIYLFATLLYFSIEGAVYSSFFSAMALLFGKTHLTTNVGILLTSSVAFNLTAPVMIKTILASYGWFALFGSACGLNIVALVLCILFVP